MCREFGKIDQNFSIKLLTNMDQYAVHIGKYVRIVLLTLRPSICYAQLHMYINLDITIVYRNEFIVNILHFTPLCSTI